VQKKHRNWISEMLCKSTYSNHDDDEDDNNFTANGVWNDIASYGTQETLTSDAKLKSKTRKS